MFGLMDHGKLTTTSCYTWPSGRVIVGAGPWGLVPAALREQNIPFVLQRADCVASLWQRRTDDRLNIHLPKQFCQLLKFPLQFIEHLESPLWRVKTVANAESTRTEDMEMELKTSSRYTEPFIAGERACVPFVVIQRPDWIASIWPFATKSSLRTCLGQDRNDIKSLVTSSTTANVILVIPLEVLPLLSMSLDDMVEIMLFMTKESRNTVYEIFKYVPYHILGQIIATKPESDVTIIECVNPVSRRQTLYGFWKKNKVVPQSLQKNQWIEIMGHVKDQGSHEVCWAVVGAEIVSAVRFIKGFDIVKTEYSIQDIVDFTNPEERSRQKKETGHYCYPWYVDLGLEYVSRAGVQREEARPYQIDCKKDVLPRIPSNLGYIREAVQLETIEDALVVLLEHPVASAIPIFKPDYWQIKNEIYRGPTTRFSTFEGMHAVNIVGAGEENGEKYVLVRSSHGKGIGEDGNLKVSIEIMMVCLTPCTTSAGEIFYSWPRPLLSQFTFPKLLSAEEEYTRKKNEPCTEENLLQA